MNLRILAISLMILVLTLPLASAASIQGYVIGSDYETTELRNIVAGEDEVTIVAEVSGFDPETDNVYYDSITGDISFDKCESGTCTLELNKRLFESRPYTYDVRLEAPGEFRSDSIVFYPDTEGASVISVEADRNIVRPQDQITFTVDSRDESCRAPQCATFCSGIEKVTISEGSLSNEEAEMNIFTGSCDSALSQTFVMQDITSKTGDINLLFQAYDRVGNDPKIFKTLTITVDDEPPQLQAEGYELLYQNKDVTNYRSPLSNVIFRVPISDTHRSAIADLSNLGGSRTQALSCDRFTCQAPTPLNLVGYSHGEEDIQVSITLTDQLGNLGTYEIEKEIFIDLEGPELEDIELSTAEIDGINTFGSSVNISVEYEDEGSGVEKLFLDASSVNPSASAIQSTHCDEEKCYFPAIPVTRSGSATLRVYGADRLNNPAVAVSIPVIADNVAPVFIDAPKIEFKKVNYQTELDEDTTFNFPSAGDTLVIETLVSEPLNLFAYADARELNNDGWVVAECEGADVDKWKPKFPDGTDGRVDLKDSLERPVKCTFEIKIETSGNHIDEDLKLYFEDPFGNRIQENIPLPNIYGLRDEENPNYWTNKVTCSPKNLDRLTGELIEQNVYCVVELLQKGNAGIQGVLEVQLNGCDSTNGYLKDEEIGNQLSSKPYLKLVFDKDEYEVNRENITCSLDILSIIDNDILENVEEEEVNIQIGFFNNPLGTPDNAAVATIQQINDKYNTGMSALIGNLNALIKIAKTICKAVNGANSLSSAYQMVAGKNVDPQTGCPMRVSADVVKKYTNEEISNKLMGLCDIVNCRPSREEGAQAELGWGDRVYNTLDIGGVMSRETCTNGECVRGDPGSYVDANNNIYLSVATGCIPGLITNLEKYRQLQCFYGVCLQQISIDSGLPPTACEEQHAYNTCKYFVGPIFTAFPLLGAFDQFVNTVKTGLTDPFVALGWALDAGCASGPGCVDGESYTVCNYVNIISSVTQTYQSLSNIIQSYGYEGQDFCGELEDYSEL